MADKNIVMASADEIRSTGFFSEAEIQEGINSEGGYVGTATPDEKIGPVKYFITLRRTAVLPQQMGDRSDGASYGSSSAPHVNAE